MISANDLNLAREFIFRSTNTGKWNKPHWQAAAAAMAWFIRELPGSPLLMNRALKLMTGHSDAAIAMSEATNLIRAQSLDASILNTNTNASSLTPTQAPPLSGRSLEEVLEEDLDLDASLITSGQSATDSRVGTGMSAAAAAAANFSKQGRTAPTTFAPAPAAVAAAAGASVAAGAVAAAAAAAAGDTSAARTTNPHVHKTIPDVHKTHKKTPVCSYLWRRMLCRRSNCKSRHPELCGSSACLPIRSPDCDKFHGHFRAEKEDKPHSSSSSRPGGNGCKFRSNQGNGVRGVLPPTSRFSSRTNNSSITARPPTKGDNRKELEKSRRELERTMGELRCIKGTLGTLGSLRPVPVQAFPRPSNPTSGNTYSAAVKSGQGQHRYSFAEIIAAAVQSALVSAGIVPHCG